MDNSLTREFELFTALYAHVAKEKITPSQRMAIVKLNEICKSRYGAGELAALVRANKPAPQPQAERQIAGKERGDRSERRSPSPVKQGEPTAQQKRLARIADRQGRQERVGKLAAHEVVADRPKRVRQFDEVAASKISDEEMRVTVEKLSKIESLPPSNLKTGQEYFLNQESEIQLSTGAIFSTETGRTENDLNTDARELSAKDLIEKYGRDLVFERLTELGEPAEMLEQKTDRQLANLLKKRMSE